MRPNPSQVAERWMAQRVASRYVAAKVTEKKLQEMQFRHPETGNKVMFKSLPPQEQAKIREQFSEAGVYKEKGLKDSLMGLLKAVPKASKAMVKALKAAPPQAQRLFTDTKYRNDLLKGVANKLKDKEFRKKAVAEVWKAAKTEARNLFVESPKILARMADGQMPTSKDLKVLWGSGIYVAGTILGALGPAGALFGGSKALSHSLAYHAMFQATSAAVDEMFLGVEAIESAAMAGGVANAVGFGTGDLPGIGHVMEAVRQFVAAEKKGPEKDERLDKFVTALYDKLVEKLEKGFSDEEIKSILEKGR